MDTTYSRFVHDIFSFCSFTHIVEIIYEADFVHGSGDVARHVARHATQAQVMLSVVLCA